MKFKHDFKRFFFYQGQIYSMSNNLRLQAMYCEEVIDLAYKYCRNGMHRMWLVSMNRPVLEAISVKFLFVEFKIRQLAKKSKFHWLQSWQFKFTKIKVKTDFYAYLLWIEDFQLVVLHMEYLWTSKMERHLTMLCLKYHEFFHWLSRWLYIC